ncbi:MAG TPA: DUF445 family protein [Gemmataceae bacterium]|nr:DUF445 family protein [Gemmataceae bacterium]
MGAPKRVDRIARLSLLLALGVAAVGKILEHHPPAKFWGGLLSAFGEAALVGGLADWFAVRALFVHPFGIPFPHTALVPRNRRRIVRQIGDLVQNEWLPQSLLTAKVNAFDFVGDGLLPVVGPLRPHLRELLRSAGLDVLDGIDADELSAFLARGLAGAADGDGIGPALGDLARRAREERWLEPVLREWVRRLEAWADSPASQQAILGRLRQAANTYRERSWFKRLTMEVAEAVGGVDLPAAAGVLRAEIKRFAADQLADEGAVQEVVRDGLANLEQRLREDPEFVGALRGFALQGPDGGTLPVLLGPVLQSLREQGRRELEAPDSHLLAAAMNHLDGWLKRLETDAELRERVNGWARRLAVQLVEQHHALVGKLVEEQLNRLSEERLSEVIEDKVGEDLNWIRLNGTFVGGLVGVVLYLSFSAASAWLPH